MRKSIDTDKIKTGITKEQELYIITKPKPLTVEDYLPKYTLDYEGINTPIEAEDMARSLIDFIKANKQLVLDNYNASNTDAVQEGFQRAIAISELFIKSLYLDGDLSD